MNKDRRAKLLDIVTRLQNINSEIVDLKDEEQTYYDDMPESIQGGDKGSNAQTAIDAMESAESSIDDAISSLEEAQQ
jgi:hypothetical protein